MPDQPITPTPQQVAAARTLLGWTSYQLAARCEMGQHVVASFESTGHMTSNRNRSDESRMGRLAVIQAVLEAEGVEFTSELGRAPGVSLRPRQAVD